MMLRLGYGIGEIIKMVEDAGGDIVSVKSEGGTLYEVIFEINAIKKGE